MISMRLEGDDPLLRGLKKFQDRAARARITDDIAAYGEESTRQRFISQEDPEGHAWKPSRRATAQNGQTLIDHGQLLGSLTRLSGEDFAEWGSNKIYAGIHQFGGVIVPKDADALRFKTINGWVTAKKVTMPARAFLGINDHDREEIGNIVTSWASGAFE